MKLKKVEKAGFKKGSASIRITRMGSIEFSSEFCREAKVESVKKVGFYQDDDRPTDWYASFQDDEENELRKTRGKSPITNNVTVARGILSSNNINPTCQP